MIYYITRIVKRIMKQELHELLSTSLRDSENGI